MGGGVSHALAGETKMLTVTDQGCYGLSEDIVEKVAQIRL